VDLQRDEQAKCVLASSGHALPGPKSAPSPGICRLCTLVDVLICYIPGLRWDLPGDGAGGRSGVWETPWAIGFCPVSMHPSSCPCYMGMVVCSCCFVRSVVSDPSAARCCPQRFIPSWPAGCSTPAPGVFFISPCPSPLIRASALPCMRCTACHVCVMGATCRPAHSPGYPL
jgi:hypothetical protein